MKCGRAGVVLVLGFAAGVAPAPSSDGPYSRLKEIPIGGEGGWDYLSVDEGARRLYVSHATKVVVVDLDKDKVVGEIAPRRACTGSRSRLRSGGASSATAGPTR